MYRTDALEVNLFARHKTLFEQARELKQLREENARLTEHVKRMQDGMRRCLTCEYRLATGGGANAEFGVYSGEFAPADVDSHGHPPGDQQQQHHHRADGDADAE